MTMSHIEQDLVSHSQGAAMSDTSSPPYPREWGEKALRSRFPVRVPRKDLVDSVIHLFEAEAEEASTEKSCTTENDSTTVAENDSAAVVESDSAAAPIQPVRTQSESANSQNREGHYLPAVGGKTGVFVEHAYTWMEKRAVAMRAIRRTERDLDDMRALFAEEFPEKGNLAARRARVVKDSDIVSHPRSHSTKGAGLENDSPALLNGEGLEADSPAPPPRSMYAVSGLSMGEIDSLSMFPAKANLSEMSESLISTAWAEPDCVADKMRAAAILLKEAHAFRQIDNLARFAAKDPVDYMLTGEMLGELCPTFAIAECAKGESKSSDQGTKPAKQKKKDKSAKQNPGTPAVRTAPPSGNAPDEDDDESGRRRGRRHGYGHAEETGNGQGTDEGEGEPKPEDSSDVPPSPVSADGDPEANAYYTELADKDSPPLAKQADTARLEDVVAKQGQQLVDLTALLSRFLGQQPMQAAAPESDSKARSMPKALTKLNTRIPDVNGQDKLELHDWLRELPGRLELCGVDVDSSQAVLAAVSFFKTDSVLHHWWQQWKGENETPGSVAELQTLVTEQFPLGEAEQDTAKNRLRNIRRTKYSSYVEFQNAFSRLTRLSGVKEKELLLTYFRDALPPATRTHITSMELWFKAADMSDKLTTLQQYHTVCSEFESKSNPTFVKQEDKPQGGNENPKSKRRRERDRADTPSRPKSRRPTGPPSAGGGQGKGKANDKGRNRNEHVPQWLKDQGVSFDKYEHRLKQNLCLVCGGDHRASECKKNKSKPSGKDSGGKTGKPSGKPRSRG